MQRSGSSELRRFLGKNLWKGNLAEMRGDRAADGVPINSSHPLVGTWFEEWNPINVTSVAYTIKARAGRFNVSGKDKDGGVVLRISKTTWDGEKMRFVSIYPPTKHKAHHEFWLTEKGRARHRVEYMDEYGTRTENESWRNLGAQPAKDIR